MFWLVGTVAVLYMASSRLPNGLIYCEQVLDCIYTSGLFVARRCLPQWISPGDSFMYSRLREP